MKWKYFPAIEINQTHVFSISFLLNFVQKKRTLQQKRNHKIQSRIQKRLQHLSNVFFHFIFCFALLQAQWHISFVYRKKSNCCESGAQQFYYTYSFFFLRRIRFQRLLFSSLFILFICVCHTFTFIVSVGVCKRLLLKIVVDRALLFSLHIIWTSQFIYCVQMEGLFSHFFYGVERTFNA